MGPRLHEFCLLTPVHATYVGPALSPNSVNGCAESLVFILLFKGLEVMSYGEGIKIDLPKPPRKLTRLVLRTVDTQEVEHIREGDVIIYGQVINGGRSKLPIVPIQVFN